MSVTNTLLKNNEAYVASFQDGSLPIPPSSHLAIVACMDARLDIYRILGLEPGQAHVIRNAGGVISEDAIRSLLISQRLLGTREIVLIHHTDCGMLTFRDDDLKDSITEDVGIRPGFSLEAFPDAHDDVRQSIARLRASSFLSEEAAIRGFVFDVETGRLEESD